MASKAEEGMAQTPPGMVGVASAPPEYQVESAAPVRSTEVGPSPPDYHAAVAFDEPPPSYQELYGEFQQATSTTQFAGVVKRAAGVFCGSLAAIILLGLICIVPIAGIVIGAMHTKDCPVEPYIPIYLVVSGAFTVFRAILNYADKGRAKYRGEEDNLEERAKPNPLGSLVSLFLACWFFAGTYWVYHVHEPSYASGHRKYCDRTTYMFAFILITIQWVVLAAAVLCTCCCGCFIAKKVRSDGQPLTG